MSHFRSKVSDGQSDKRTYELTDEERIVVTGLSMITPLGDDPHQQMEKMFQGQSAISKWTRFDTSKIFSKIGGEMGARSAGGSLSYYIDKLPQSTAKAAKKLISKAAWSTGHSIELALRAAMDCDFFEIEMDLEKAAVVIAGTNTNLNYIYEQFVTFMEEPDFIDPLVSVSTLDTDHAGCVSEVLGLRGGAYVVGGACASGNMALRAALDEIRNHGMERVFAVGAIYDPSMLDLHGLGLVRAISADSFNEQPEKASRPFDVRREGFVPSHGGAALVLETLASAKRRGAKIYAELLGSELSSDANHLPNPSQDGQVRALKRLLSVTGVKPEQIDFVSAHATSTSLGDLVEIRSLKEVFGDHAYRLKINAPKSMLGHTCWSSGIVESVVGILQMNAGRLHPSINIEEMDPEVDLHIVRDRPETHQIEMMLNNSFGFGGLNCVSLFARYKDV